jgi:hypothetical protein
VQEDIIDLTIKGRRRTCRYLTRQAGLIYNEVAAHFERMLVRWTAHHNLAAEAFKKDLKKREVIPALQGHRYADTGRQSPSYSSNTEQLTGHTNMFRPGGNYSIFSDNPAKTLWEGNRIWRRQSTIPIST